MVEKMVTKKIVIFCLIIILSGCATKSATKSLPSGVTPTYAIGDTGPAGGKIFITPSTSGNSTSKYFEAAPADLGTESVWCSDTTNLLGVSGTTIGTGAANTTKMLLTCTSGAAFSADVYSTTNNSKIYSDWFLPSKDELNQIYVNKTTIGSFTTSSYWSSSEDDADGAWAQYFRLRFQYDDVKDGLNYVRPVRAFS